MHCKLISRSRLSAIPSASAIEIINGHIYVISDDSAEVFMLGHALEPGGSVPLFKDATPDQGSVRIAKSVKPDLEASLAISRNGLSEIIIFGSGSTNARERGFVLRCGPQTATVAGEFSLTALYSVLREDALIAASDCLNIEAAVATAEQVILCHRGRCGGPSVIVQIERTHFETWLDSPTLLPPPHCKTSAIMLPRLNNVEAGLSGAAAIPGINSVIVTATAEDSRDSIADGQIIGSLIGRLDLSPQGPELSWVEPIKDQNSQLLIAKIESIAIAHNAHPPQLDILAVSDDDLGGSELFRFSLMV